MISGEDVEVISEVEVGRDRFNVPIYEEVAETVEDVLVAPGALTDVLSSNRPDGVMVAYTLHFPKAFTGDLAGARIKVRGGTPLHVIGHPERYTAENTPGRWDMPVELEKVEG